jgi:hypothetical protein
MITLLTPKVNISSVLFTKAFVGIASPFIERVAVDIKLGGGSIIGSLSEEQPIRVSKKNK